jgi:hypothetical protein
VQGGIHGPRLGSNRARSCATSADRASKTGGSSQRSSPGSEACPRTTGCSRSEARRGAGQSGAPDSGRCSIKACRSGPNSAYRATESRGGGI